MSTSPTTETCIDEANTTVCGQCDTYVITPTLKSGFTAMYDLSITCNACKNGWVLTNRPMTATLDKGVNPPKTNPTLLDMSVGCSTPVPKLEESNNTVAIVIMIVVAIYVLGTIGGLIVYFLRKKKAADEKFETPEQIALRKMKEAVIAAGADPSGVDGSMMVMGGKATDSSTVQQIPSPERTRGSGHVNIDVHQPQPFTPAEFPSQVATAQVAAKQLKRRVPKKVAPVE
jgi:hypothetical protein